MGFHVRMMPTKDAQWEQPTGKIQPRHMAVMMTHGWAMELG